MNKYELALVISPVLEGDAKEAELSKVKDLIERFNGQIEKVDDWGKRKLAYEIKKLKEGYYYFIAFSADVTVPAELESRLRIMENVLRYLIIRVEE